MLAMCEYGIKLPAIMIYEVSQNRTCWYVVWLGQVGTDTRRSAATAQLTKLRKYEPILSKLQINSRPIRLANQLLQIPTIRPLAISWTAYADNSPPRSTSVKIKDISIVYELMGARYTFVRYGYRFGTGARVYVEALGLARSNPLKIPPIAMGGETFFALN